MIVHQYNYTEKNKLSQSHWCQSQAFFTSKLISKICKYIRFSNENIQQNKICFFLVRYLYFYPGLCQLPYQDVHRSSLSINWPSGPISGLTPIPTSQSRPVNTVDLWRPWPVGILSMTDSVGFEGQQGHFSNFRSVFILAEPAKIPLHNLWVCRRTYTYSIEFVQVRVCLASQDRNPKNVKNFGWERSFYRGS